MSPSRPTSKPPIHHGFKLCNFAAVHSESFGDDLLRGIGQTSGRVWLFCRAGSDNPRASCRLLPAMLNLAGPNGAIPMLSANWYIYS
jgi:hypothetical protein